MPTKNDITKVINDFVKTIYVEANGDGRANDMAMDSFIHDLADVVGFTIAHCMEPYQMFGEVVAIMSDGILDGMEALAAIDAKAAPEASESGVAH